MVIGRKRLDQQTAMRPCGSGGGVKKEMKLEGLKGPDLKGLCKSWQGIWILF